MIAEGMKIVAAGANPVQVRRRRAGAAGCCCGGGGGALPPLLPRWQWRRLAAVAELEAGGATVSSPHQRPRHTLPCPLEPPQLIRGMDKTVEHLVA